MRNDSAGRQLMVPLRNAPLRILGAALVLFWAGCATRSLEPRNLSLLKQEIRAYVESGAYSREVAAVAAQAGRWIEERAGQTRESPGRVTSGKMTVILDLDETLLSNWPEMVALDFGHSSATWSAWVAEGRAPVIEPVREVYRTARRLGVDVIFLTGRRERDRPGTEKNLKAIDCANYAALICKPDTDKGSSAAFKTAVRKRLTEEGRVIIANIGDQQSDLVGGFAERTFKLPAPFYLSE